MTLGLPVHIPDVHSNGALLLGLVYVSISWPDGRALNTVNGTTTRLREIWMPLSHLFRRDFMFGSTVHIILFNGPDTFCRCSVGQRSSPEETIRNIAYMNAIWY